ncbi:hypothetical protein [Microlunatus sp. Y2014]|uniref:hypothetical protein n=1 Tax=Microlunatus sp. Y2014 TaxID=3418488 RepID=UPI003DA70AE3
MEPDHRVTLRVKVADDGSIHTFTVQVLHNDVPKSERATEIRGIIDPLLDEVPLSDADRQAVREAVDGEVENETGDTEWSSEKGGTFNVRTSDDITSVAVGESSTEFMPRTPLTEDHQPFLDELAARGWQCTTEDISIDCTTNGPGKIVGTLSTAGQPNNEPRLVEVRVWFGGAVPGPEDQRMIDAYEALAAVGDRGEVAAIGLRKLAEGEKLFFNSDVEFYRGDAYYQVQGVQFI